MKLRALLLAALLASPACYRTVYKNLQQRNALPVVETPETQAKRPKGGWQGFFLYGWFPLEKRIDAAAICGGSEHVATLETRRTFWQGLVTAVTSYYINIYAPWNAKVRCDHTPPEP